MAEFVYKRLPAGGYTALPAESPVVRQRLISQGWSLEPPMDTPPAPVVEPAVTIEPVEDAPAPKKRGRQRSESVN